MQMSNICAANVDPNFLSFEFLKCSTLDQGMHQAVADAEWLLALPAPAQSIAGLYSDTRVAIVDALDPSPIVAGLGFSQSLLDLLAVFFFALVFAAAYLRVRDWVQKSSPRLSNMSIIKKSDACFHILFYAVIWVLGLVCIWNDMFNMCVAAKFSRACDRNSAEKFYFDLTLILLIHVHPFCTQSGRFCVVADPRISAVASIRPVGPPAWNAHVLSRSIRLLPAGPLVFAFHHRPKAR